MRNQIQNFENRKDRNKKTKVEILTSVLLVGVLSFVSPSSIHWKSWEKNINNDTKIASLDLSKKSIGKIEFIKDLITEVENELTYKNKYGTREEFETKKDKIFSFMRKTDWYFQKWLKNLDIIDTFKKCKEDNKILLEELQDWLNYMEKLEQEISVLKSKEWKHQSEFKQDKILKEIIKNLIHIKKNQIKENKEHIDYCKYLLKKEIKNFIISFLRKEYQ